MKRTHETDSEGEEETKRFKESDLDVFHEIQDKLNHTGNELNEELEIAKRKYYVSYFKKAYEKLSPMSDVININNIPDTIEGFYKAFSISKICVATTMEIKKTKAFTSIYDMVTNAVGKVVHDKVIVPYMGSIVQKDVLENAYKVYQTELTCEDDCHTTELHCLSYLIQNEIEKKDNLKIPNPIYNRFTQQMTAVSKYVSEILKSIVLTSK